MNPAIVVLVRFGILFGGIVLAVAGAAVIGGFGAALLAAGVGLVVAVIAK